MTPPKNQAPISVPDLTADRLQALQTLVPEAFSEGKIDYEKLRLALGDLDDPATGSGQAAPERYAFSWAGKRDAIRLLQTPTRAAAWRPPRRSRWISRRITTCSSRATTWKC